MGCGAARTRAAGGRLVGVSISELYRRFAVAEAAGHSRCYEQWALGVADDARLLALLEELPKPRRQPNLLFAAARHAGIAPGPYGGFRDKLLQRWPQVRSVMLTRRTQTNEPGRCATLLPILAALPQPLALLEVGASAGLCLYPDRFSYRYGTHLRLDPPDGPGAAVLDCTISGPVPVPAAVPRVVWRAGIDLHPLDVTRDPDVDWLRTLIWPEQQHRRTRLAAAIEVARADPPRLVAGDLNDVVEGLAAQAPAGATLVIFHSAVLAYLTDADRARFVATVTRLPGHWISNEAPSALTTTADVRPAAGLDPRQGLFVLAYNGEPVALAGGHGQSLRWLERTG
jgi:hypothetical protein